MQTLPTPTQEQSTVFELATGGKVDVYPLITLLTWNDGPSYADRLDEAMLYLVHAPSELISGREMADLYFSLREVRNALSKTK